MRNKLFLLAAFMLGVGMSFAAGESPERMGSQLVVTFDCPPNVLCKQGIRYSPTCPDPDVKLDVYYPKNFKKADFKKVPCILMIHGGGWSMGNEKKFAMMAAYAASRNYVVACISYRLLPEYELEDCIEDCWLALKWLRKNAGEFGGDPDKIGVTGGSAGGHLACLLATVQNSQICKKVFVDGTNSKIQASVPMAPVSEMGMSNKYLYRIFKGDKNAEERAQKASPINYVSKESAPMHILHAKGDRSVPIEQSVKMQAVYKKAGLDCPITFYDSSNHAFWNTHPIGKERMQSWTDCVDIFDKMLK